MLLNLVSLIRGWILKFLTNGNQLARFDSNTHKWRGGFGVMHTSSPPRIVFTNWLWHSVLLTEEHGLAISGFRNVIACLGKMADAMKFSRERAERPHQAVHSIILMTLIAWRPANNFQSG
jgi:hypothetical protein